MPEPRCNAVYDVQTGFVRREKLALHARWKIENERFNLLKKHGYHMEHNIGHGKQGLSNTLMTLNLIAFAFHAVCNHLCELW